MLHRLLFRENARAGQQLVSLDDAPASARVVTRGTPPGSHHGFEFDESFATMIYSEYTAEADVNKGTDVTAMAFCNDGRGLCSTANGNGQWGCQFAGTRREGDSSLVRAHCGGLLHRARIVRLPSRFVFPMFTGLPSCLPQAQQRELCAASTDACATSLSIDYQDLFRADTQGTAHDTTVCIARKAKRE